jgi:hypothetical protein
LFFVGFGGWGGGGGGWAVGSPLHVGFPTSEPG